MDAHWLGKRNFVLSQANVGDMYQPSLMMTQWLFMAVTVTDIWTTVMMYGHLISEIIHGMRFTLVVITRKACTHSTLHIFVRCALF